MNLKYNYIFKLYFIIWEIREGSILKNPDGTISYRAVFPGTNNWYLMTEKEEEGSGDPQCQE